MSSPADQKAPSGLTRRQLLLVGAAGLAMGSGLLLVPRRYFRMPQHAQAFVAKVDNYQSDIADAIIKGMRELGVSLEEVKGKRILLKPNLVETASGAPHINTHPLVLRGAIEAFLKLGASTVMVAEGPGHRRDTLAVYEESGSGRCSRPRIVSPSMISIIGPDMSCRTPGGRVTTEDTDVSRACSRKLIGLFLWRR